MGVHGQNLRSAPRRELGRWWAPAVVDLGGRRGSGQPGWSMWRWSPWVVDGQCQRGWLTTWRHRCGAVDVGGLRAVVDMAVDDVGGGSLHMPSSMWGWLTWVVTWRSTTWLRRRPRRRGRWRGVHQHGRCWVDVTPVVLFPLSCPSRARHVAVALRSAWTWRGRRWCVGLDVAGLGVSWSTWQARRGEARHDQHRWGGHVGVGHDVALRMVGKAGEWVGLPGMGWLARWCSCRSVTWRLVELGCVSSCWRWLVVVEVVSFGCRATITLPCLAQVWTFARGFDNEEGSDEGGGGGMRQRGTFPVPNPTWSVTWFIRLYRRKETCI